ncbi:uncharacterized protein LACBIDRAFT_316826 [Laccaria bicolor S238N-H82]|uniref:Predicted protein n=1 Tax=Laccaria bicolor (strain S238N-H82 / ATCC MYA-4686) TaxID=486041 RepID=B0E1P6_LACBS|nr:uncharacterized protein LACBIDRAFT_316826 [Laccaria bicolor S238N-H82]EDQ99232.1 predicted protein [Laccaria bicolor S238N-H82]|eukprot:XP_001890129.1 predicted protein [Laccaria bicolor S238N-H82]
MMCPTPHLCVCVSSCISSFSALRRLQARLTKEINVEPEHHTSSLGNHFYMNHPIDLLALDWANPLVRDHIQVYPEICDTISEPWQADKWLKEIPFDELSPMWADWKVTPHRHFYIKEVAQLANNEFVIPMRWVMVKKVEHVEFYRVKWNEETGKYSLFGSDSTHLEGSTSTKSSRDLLYRLPASELKYNFLELEKGGYKFEFSECLGTSANPSRQIAKGRPLFVLRIMPWCDDVSGNRSKQYNAHVNMYTTNASLPHRKLSQEYFVRFCSTSPHASALEQFEALSKDFGKWKEAYDCKLEQDILFQIYPHAGPADNPQQAESCSCGGLGSSHNCRYDENGGTKAFKETNEGYHAMFSPGVPRTPEKTIARIKEQIHTACLGVKDHVDALQTATGVKDKIACHWIDKLIEMARERQNTRISNVATRDATLNNKNLKGPAREAMKKKIKEEIQEELLKWVIMQPPDRYEQYPENSDEKRNPSLRPGDHFNVLLRVRGLDPHKDSPCELLHTYLLGEDKYVWHDTSKKWDKKKEELFAVCLQGSSLEGLTIDSLRARYCVQYKNSLIGKHFKSLQQLAVFHLNDSLCPPHLFEIWKASGELGALLWFPEIKNMDQYLADLEICIANLLDLWAVYDPNRIIVKFKLHVLPHIIDDIRRFGPAVLFSTEVFECWNAIFRLCSVLSNHLSPSHDIADTLLDMERFKHIVSGGWWKTEDNDWTQAGKHVRNYLKEEVQLQRRLGWTDISTMVPGTVKLESSKKRRPGSWKESLGQHWTAERDGCGDQSQTWARCRYLVSMSQDVCKVGSWVFSKRENGTDVAAGRILLILLPNTTTIISLSTAATILLEIFNVEGRKNERLNMPILSASGETLLVAAKDILFLFNAQHDCKHGKCRIVEKPALQERETTTRMQGTIEHLDNTRYFINMHALHNAHLIREVLPRDLTKHQLRFPNRRAKHDELAAGLRVTGPAARKAAAEQSTRTRNRNKQKNLQAQARAGLAVITEEDPEELNEESMLTGVQDDGLSGGREDDEDTSMEGMDA